MRWDVSNKVPYNSFDYFERSLITGNGFREYDVRWLLGKEINPNGFVVLGKAYGTFLKERYQGARVIVGYDFRQYSQDLSRSLLVGLLSVGCEVIDIGLALTPMVYFAQHHFGVRGAAMVTASHNENGWTGLKLAKGLSSTLEPEDIQAFKEITLGGHFASGTGDYRTYDDLFEKYCTDLLREGPLSRRLKVVLAAGNGTAGRFAPTFLTQLGCEVIPLDCEGDWDFPRHNPNPEDVSFLHSISKRTVETEADIGVGIDGDGDRIGVVDDRGREIFSDKLGLLVAQWISQKAPQRKVVIDVKSTGLFYSDPILQKSGTSVITWKTGHSYIKAKVAETDAIAGFEKSGHWFFNHPFGRGYDDALASSMYVLRFLSSSGRRLSDLVDDLPVTWQSPTLGVFCADDSKYRVVEGVTKRYEDDYRSKTSIAGFRIKEIVKVNGIRFVLEDDSWGLVRASSNKPSLVVVAEARSTHDQLYDIVDHIKSRLASTGEVGEYDQELPPRPAVAQNET